MKLDRPGVAILLIFFIGGSVFEYGVEKAAAGVFLILIGIMLYKAFARNTK